MVKFSYTMAYNGFVIGNVNVNSRMRKHFWYKKVLNGLIDFCMCECLFFVCWLFMRHGIFSMELEIV